MNLARIYPKTRFLIVDDFENFRSSLRLMLGSFGVGSIETANTADDALEKCEDTTFDVILCDFNLGPGKTGQNVLEELRFNKKLKRTNLFIMVTAETSREIVLGAREQQPDGYIAKPITKSVLQKRLDQLLMQRQILKPINREIDHGNIPQAIALCHQLLKESRRYQSWCQQTLAQLYLESGDLDSAERIYRDVLSSREITWAQLGLGRVMAAKHANDQAIACFEQVLDQNPHIVEALDDMASVYESKGQAKKAQQVLNEAAILSPRHVARQERLGSLSEKIGDLEGASDAFRMAVKHSQQSIFKHSGNYLNLGRCLSELCDEDSSLEGKERATEAIKVLDKANEQFKEETDTQICSSLISSRVHAGQNRESEASKSLEQAETLMGDAPPSPDIGLEMARTLFRLKENERAEKLLIDLSERFPDDKKLQQRIESLLDEPVGHKQKLKAKELNAQGFQAFDAQEFAEACKHFEEALKYTPKNPALNLNLVQSLLKRAEIDEANSQKHFSDAEIYLNRIKHIPEKHRQYKRMQQLAKRLAQQRLK